MYFFRLFKKVIRLVKKQKFFQKYFLKTVLSVKKSLFKS